MGLLNSEDAVERVSLLSAKLLEEARANFKPLPVPTALGEMFTYTGKLNEMMSSPADAYGREHEIIRRLAAVESASSSSTKMASTEDLTSAVSTIDEKLAMKATVTALDAKADKSYVDNKLATKATITAVDAKADKSYVNDAVASAVSTINSDLATKATVATMQSTIDGLKKQQNDDKSTIDELKAKLEQQNATFLAALSNIEQTIEDKCGSNRHRRSTCGNGGNSDSGKKEGGKNSASGGNGATDGDGGAGNDTNNGVDDGDDATNPEDTKTTTAGTTAGIVVAGVLVLVAVLVALFFWWRRKHTNDEANMAQQLQGSKTTAYNNPQFDNNFVAASRCQTCGVKRTQCVCRERAESIAQGNIPKFVPDEYIDVDGKGSSAATQEPANTTTHAPWFVHGMDRGKCKARVLAAAEQGSFLVRISRKTPGAYAFCMNLGNGRVQEDLAKPDRSGKLALYFGNGKKGTPSFPDLQSLVEHCQTNTILPAAGIVLKLGAGAPTLPPPCSRWRAVFRDSASLECRVLVHVRRSRPWSAAVLQ